MVVYAFTNLMYVLITKKVVYPNMNWKNLITYLYVVVAAVFMNLIFWFLLWVQRKKYTIRKESTVSNILI